MFLTAFYMPLIPTCIIWGLLALNLQYLVNKYNFLRSKCIKFHLGGELGLEMVIFLISLTNLFDAIIIPPSDCTSSIIIAHGFRIPDLGSSNIFLI